MSVICCKTDLLCCPKKWLWKDEGDQNLANISLLAQSKQISLIKRTQDSLKMEVFYWDEEDNTKKQRWKSEGQTAPDGFVIFKITHFQKLQAPWW